MLKLGLFYHFVTHPTTQLRDIIVEICLYAITIYDINIVKIGIKNINHKIVYIYTHIKVYIACRETNA